MSKKIKISSIFLATSLIITPTSNVLLQNNNDRLFNLLESNIQSTKDKS